MRKIILLLVVACCSFLQAQEKKFVIRGEMTCDSLRFENGTIKKLYLSRLVNDNFVAFDSVEVRDKKFVFEGIVPADLDVYNITGFDNGAVQLFLEEGEITVSPFDARFPLSSRVSGTPCNEVFSAYLDANARANNASASRMKNAIGALPHDTPEEQQALMALQSSVFYSNNIYTKTALLDFIFENIESPVALYIIKYNIMPFFNPQAVEQNILCHLPAALRTHSVYKEIVNQIRASELKVGNFAPDIVGNTPDGTELHLSDFNGKYLLLDFWASWCGPCRGEFPHIKEALAYSEKNDNLVVLSYSLDSKEKDWLGAIEKNVLTHKNWVHISALHGWSSQAAKLFNVQGVPHTVLINPQGRVVAFGLRGGAMVETLKKITDGTLSEPEQSAATAENSVEPLSADILSSDFYAEYNSIGSLAARIRFLLDNNSSAVAAAIMHRELAPILSDAYAEQLFNTLSPSLQGSECHKAFGDYIQERNGKSASDEF